MPEQRNPLRWPSILVTGAGRGLGSARTCSLRLAGPSRGRDSGVEMKRFWWRRDVRDAVVAEVQSPVARPHPSPAISRPNPGRSTPSSPASRLTAESDGSSTTAEFGAAGRADRAATGPRTSTSACE